MRLRNVIAIGVAITVAMPIAAVPATAKTTTKKPVPAPAPAPSPAPAPVVNAGPMDVTNFSVTVGSSVNAVTGARTPTEATAIAIVGGPNYATYDEVFFNVRPVGGAWDRTLDFPYVVMPLSFGGYNTIILSTSRQYPRGSYDVRVAARQGATMIYDEVIRTFTML